MDLNNFFLYILIFTIVLFPAVVLQAWLNKPAGSLKGESQSNHPTVFRLMHLPIMLFCNLGLGSLLCSLRPKKKDMYIKQITIANVKLTPDIIFSAQIVYSLTFAILGAIWFLILPLEQSWAILALLIGAFVGWITPSTALESSANKRQAQIVKGLPFAIDLIGSAMRSGLDFGAAIRYYVSLGVEGPLSMEFGIMLRQIELGKTRVEALNCMAERICSNEFTSFVGSVAHGTEIGASIVETMNIQSEEMRRARFNLAERKAARAPSLMILPMAIFILPAVFIIIFTPVYLKIQASGMGAFFK